MRICEFQMDEKNKLNAYTIVLNHGKSLFSGIKEVVTNHMQNKVIEIF